MVVRITEDGVTRLLRPDGRLGRQSGTDPERADPRVVEAMASVMATHAEIAAALRMSQSNFTTMLSRDPDLRAAFTRGRASGALSLRRKQFSVAMEGSTAMLRWLGKQYLGQSEKVRVATVDGDAVAADALATVRWDGDLDEIVEELERAVEGGGEPG